MNFRYLLLSCAVSLAGFGVSSGLANGQESEEKNAISALGFLVGNWEGPGISYAADGSQTGYHDTEFVRFDLDQKLLLINAAGKRDDGTISYQLHTVIYYDAAAGHYVYTPYAGRTPRSFHCQLDETPKLLCLNADQNYRLTFQRLSNGAWNEFGERLEGDLWSKSFETILHPVEEQAN